ncbi:uncharacterized protein PAC_03445 [Phialocephala subalpina]|uniref:Azaphilone pigments biosynthesis cluster protein L N-terminal domain-containing protein n=1 Tax=Phialocephala subalpina TaxID=576137 RepID=A0A1L7WLB6_9HELO|nr:uncharacterized protein PAC_03445 [Phialocephala subalpina]
MDPLSIAASAFAVFQAADRLGGLLGSVKPFLNARRDVLTLLHELRSIQDALQDLQTTVTIALSPSPLRQSCLQESIDTCLTHLSGLEALVSKSCKFTGAYEKLAVVDVKRLSWVRRKGDIERIKRQLKGTLSSLQLALNSLNIINQVNLSLSVDNLGRSLQDYQNSLEIRSISHQSGIEALTLDTKSEGNNVPDAEVLRRTFLLFPEGGIAPKTEKLTGINRTTTESRKMQFQTHIRLESQCSCQKSGFRTLGLLTGILGMLLIEWTGQVLGNSNCDHQECTKRAPSSLTITYYGPSWMVNVATRCSLRLASPPSLSLSFPRIRPPDAEIFVGIRTGNSEYIKSLLIEGRGSVADVMAPYGFSTLLLAILHRRADVYQLLLSAGASRVPQIHLTCPVEQLDRFWTDYVSQEYEMSASDVLLDYTYQLGSLPHNQLFSGHGRDSLQTTILHYHSLTRLHKSTIGLTSENLEEVIPFSRGEIDAPDSLGRTALHFAAYQCNFEAAELLLKHEANPDLIDHHGKAPLHVAAGLGSIPIIKALINSRCDLEIRDQFGNTPVHLACLLGHVHTVELLLDAGANVEALNAHGETPVRQTILNDRIELTQLLHQRGAAFHGSNIYACGCNPIIKAVWFNSHKAFRFLVSLHMRVDQKHKSGRTLLHTLADNGDHLTMQLFLEVTHPSLARLDVDELDSRGWTAMDYLKSRRDSDELMESFLKVVEHVQQARALQAARSKEIFTPNQKVVLEPEEQEVFFDAVESQEGV